jgi:hypothetical protein
MNTNLATQFAALTYPSALNPPTALVAGIIISAIILIGSIVLLYTITQHRKKQPDYNPTSFSNTQGAGAIAGTIALIAFIISCACFEDHRAFRVFAIERAESKISFIQNPSCRIVGAVSDLGVLTVNLEIPGEENSITNVILGQKTVVKNITAHQRSLQVDGDELSFLSQHGVTMATSFKDAATRMVSK